MIQGSEEWFKARTGVVTASRFAAVMSSDKLATYKNYLAEIVAERLTGQMADSYTSKEMQWGIDHEDEARMVYEAIKGVEVQQTGLLKHAELEAGASPDGLVGADGGIEIKCPNTATHITTLLSGKAPSKYYAQMQGQMWIGELKWVDFVSYDPRLDDKNAVFITRVERDDEYIKDLEERVTKFLAEVEIMLSKLK